MTNGRIVAAQALSPVLEAFRNASGKVLKAVFRTYADGCLCRLILDIDGSFFVIEAIPEFDTIEVITEQAYGAADMERVDASGSMPWRDFIGKPLGWGWIAMNQQGFCDSVILSFDGITPQLLLNVVASSIKENVIARGNDS